MEPVALAISLVLNLGSVHLNTDRDFNEKNYGAGLSWRYTKDLHINTGFYRNSIDRDSKYLYVTHTLRRRGNLSYRINIGGVSGYASGEGERDKVKFAIFPSFAYNGVIIPIGYLPKEKLVTIGLQWELP